MKALQFLLKIKDGAPPPVCTARPRLVMFPHGAQKMLGRFGGYGLSGTMVFFTTKMHIPARVAFLAILAGAGKASIDALIARRVGGE